MSGEVTDEDQAAKDAADAAAATAKAEEEEAKRVADAEREAERAELKALRESHTATAKELEELKAAKVPAPVKKTAKPKDPTGDTEIKPKPKARVSSRWFGTAAYED